ncbi:hypothetical protein [Rhodopirellula sallentina]|nr:hypothetical protein [Rhodopirellula sallentina]
MLSAVDDSGNAILSLRICRVYSSRRNDVDASKKLLTSAGEMEETPETTELGSCGRELAH